MTATLSLRKAVTSIIAASPELQGREAGDREDRGDDPEADDDGRLLPALLLEVVVQRRHAEDALARELVARDLDDDRDRLEHEEPADDGEHQLVLGDDADDAERPADGERAGVAHEDHRGRRVEPQEPQGRAHHRGAEDGELAGAGDVIDLEVVGEDQIADEIGDEREAAGGDHRRHDGEPIEPIGQVDGVGRAGHHQRRDRHEEHAEIDDDGLEEGHGEGGAERAARQDDVGDGGDPADDQLRQQLAPARQPARRAPRQLAVVVDEADHAETHGHEQRHPDVAVAEIGPQQGRDGEREEDENAAHGGRALLGEEVVLRPVEADRLALALLGFEPGDEVRAEEEADQQRRHHRAARAEGEVAEKIEGLEAVGERGQEMKQHDR